MVAIRNVSLPSIGSSWIADGSGRAPASLAMRFSSSWVSWRPRAACSRRRSPAHPPNGLNAITAAARLAASNTPMMARMATRGSLMDTPVSFILPRLMFLGIIHREAVAIERIRLRGGLALLLQYLAAQRRVLQRDQQLDLRFRGFRRRRHIQHHLVARVQGGTDGHDPHIVRHGFLQVRENTGPAYPLAVEERVDEDATLQHFGILRPGQHGGELGLFGLGLPDLPVEPAHVLADVGHLRAVRQDQRNERSQRGHQQQAHRNGRQQHGADPLERLAGEVDRNLHLNCSSRWTAGSPTARRYPLPAFPAATVKAPSPRPTPRRNAARRLPSAPRIRTGRVSRAARPGCLPRRRTWGSERRQHLPTRRTVVPGTAPT